MLIRRVEERDIDQLIELCVLHAEYEKAEFDPKGKKEKLFNHLFKVDSGLQCIVVEDQGRLLGFATFVRQFSTWDADFYLYLDCLFLREELRGQSVGTKVDAVG